MTNDVYGDRSQLSSAMDEARRSRGYSESARTMSMSAIRNAGVTITMNVTTLEEIRLDAKE